MMPKKVIKHRMQHGNDDSDKYRDQQKTQSKKVWEFSRNGFLFPPKSGGNTKGGGRHSWQAAGGASQPVKSIKEAT